MEKIISMVLLFSAVVACNNSTSVKDTKPTPEPVNFTATLEWSFVDMDTRIYVEDTLSYNGILANKDSVTFRAARGDTITYELEPLESKLSDGKFIIGRDSTNYVNHYYMFDYGQTYTVEGGFKFTGD